MRRLSHGTVWLAVLLGVALACAESEQVPTQTEAEEPMAKSEGASESEATEPEAQEIALLTVKDFGTIRLELYPGKAPKTVENFVKLAREGFYEGTTFHRVIPGFMIQGGDPNTKDRDPRNDGRGGPGYTIPDERNDLKHTRGAVAMAKTSRPNSAGSQFFIVVKDSPHLDGNYTVFGRVVEGMDVVDRIVAVERDVYGRHGPPDRPLEDVAIESVRIEEGGGATS